MLSTDTSNISFKIKERRTHFSPFEYIWYSWLYLADRCPNPGSAASGTEAATATPSKVWGSSAGRIEPRGGGRGALPTSMGQQGPSAQARAGRVVGPRSAQGASPGLRVHKTLKFVVVGVLLQVVPGSAAIIKVHDQSVGTQQWEHSPLGELCPPGHTDAKRQVPMVLGSSTLVAMQGIAPLLTAFMCWC